MISTCIHITTLEGWFICGGAWLGLVAIATGIKLLENRGSKSSETTQAGTAT